ncbi:TPA: ABC transporter permease [Legionella pneumophila]|nr:ABC transporter permease [Legionella pneumophila]HAU1321858.1 ABC transporter permease [Legionella pneumophila]HBC0467073.1 ABC transporter permease [Legionella pneumophila]HBI2947490.1 ABC transporter permease [Legionella pneumophila]HDV6633004.1 ABC transporter permease [Legionella pneumophila]
MYFFRRFPMHIITFIHSLELAFRFLGHLVHSTIKVIFGKLSIVWPNTLEIIYYCGARLFILLSFIGILLGITVSQTVYVLLNPFHLHQRVLPIAQNILTHEILPVLIGFILCIQAALHLINTRLEHYQENPEAIILAQVLPIIIGMIITSLLLYVYLVSSIFFSFYLTFHFMLGFTNNEFLSYVVNSTTLFDLIYSVFKTFILCIIVGLASGYYYYEASIRHIYLRKAVSRILTRGSFWLIIASMYITLTF